MAENVQGTVYLLHFIDPDTGRSQRYGHAAHYAGWTSWDVPGRVDYHVRGRGSRLMAAVSAAGVGAVIARTWTGTKHDERRLKRRGSLCRSCPVCREDARVYRHWRSGRWFVRFLPHKRGRYPLHVAGTAVQ